MSVDQVSQPLISGSPSVGPDLLPSVPSPFQGLEEKQSDQRRLESSNKQLSAELQQIRTSNQTLGQTLEEAHAQAKVPGARRTAELHHHMMLYV